LLSSSSGFKVTCCPSGDLLQISDPPLNIYHFGAFSKIVAYNSIVKGGQGVAMAPLCPWADKGNPLEGGTMIAVGTIEAALNLQLVPT
jgi:hypothetical protein